MGLPCYGSRANTSLLAGNKLILSETYSLPPFNWAMVLMSLGWHGKKIEQTRIHEFPVDVTFWMDRPEKLEADDCPVTEGCFWISSPGCVDTGWTPTHLYQHPVCRYVAAAHNQSPDAEDECHHMTTIHKMCIAKNYVHEVILFQFFHQNHVVGVLGISLTSTLVWSVVSSSVHEQYWWRWNLWRIRKLLFSVSMHLQERGSHAILIGYLTANKLLICKFCCESGSGPVFVQILAP